MIELISVPAPADPRSAGLRRAGAKAVLVGPPSAPPLPFEVADSKTRVPPLLAGTVSRTALVNRLRAAGAFPLVLVVAPAGYGKTTLLSQWAARDVRPLRLGLGGRRRRRPGLAPAPRRCRARPDRAAASVGARAAGPRAPAGAGQGTAAPRRVDRLAPLAVRARARRRGRADHDTILPSGRSSGTSAGSMIVLSGRSCPTCRSPRCGPAGRCSSSARTSSPSAGARRDAAARRDAEPEDAEINELVEHTEGWAAGLYLTALAARAENDEGDTGTASRSPAPTATSPTTSARSTSRGSSPTG